MDTAVLEVVALDAHQINLLLSVASEVLRHAPAMVEYIDAPDLEHLARLPRDMVIRHGVLPSKDLSGNRILVIPPLAPHAIQALRMQVDEIQFVLGLESDIREALRRFANIPLPERFEALWMGRCPSAASARAANPFGPVATPRQTCAVDWLTSDSQDSLLLNARDSQMKSEDVASGNPITRPGRPTALGLADTGEFREHHARSAHSVAPTIVAYETNDDQDAFTLDLREADPSIEASSDSIERAIQDTVPPSSS